MHLGSTELLLARAVFTRSIKVLDGSHVPQNPREHDFPKKKNVLLLKVIGPVTPVWVLQPSQIMHMVSTESLLARAMFARSIKVSGWQSGAPKPREHDFPKKNVLIFLKFVGPVTLLWVLQPSQIMHMVSAESLLARAVFARSIKVLGWQPLAPKSREHDFPKKNVLTFLKSIGPVKPRWVL